MSDQPLCEDAPTLLTPQDPPPVSIFNAVGSAPYLLLCDHAANRVPARLGDLGLTRGEPSRHIAWDIGALDIAKHLARALDAPLIHSSYSRLVCDLNRYPFDDASMSAHADGTVIPGNTNLTPAARYRRMEEIFVPYHAAIAARLNDFQKAGVVPSLVSVHTCTERMNGQFRPWPISLSYASDTRLSEPLIRDLRRRDVGPVGDNEPYSVDLGVDFTVCEHAMRRGLAYLQVEFRQDLVATPETAEAWAERFLPSLRVALAEPDARKRRVMEYPAFGLAS